MCYSKKTKKKMASNKKDINKIILLCIKKKLKKKNIFIQNVEKQEELWKQQNDKKNVGKLRIGRNSFVPCMWYWKYLCGRQINVLL